MSADVKAESEEAICRVCHCDGSKEAPLYHPCKCSGSIRYVHQDCLLQWLKHKGGDEKRCELCGSEFHFRSIYREGGMSPPSLSLKDFTSAVAPRLLGHLVSASGVFVSILLWLVFLPLFSSLWLDICCVIVAERESYWNLRSLRLDTSLDALQLLACWWNGCLTTTLALFFGLGALQTIEYILAELLRLQPEQEVRIVPPLHNGNNVTLTLPCHSVIDRLSSPISVLFFRATLLLLDGFT